MSWIDTSDKIDHEDTLKRRVWSLVDLIEFKMDKMAHEIDELKDELKDYQDGKIKPIYFINYLTKFIDNLEMD